MILDFSLVCFERKNTLRIIGIIDVDVCVYYLIGSRVESATYVKKLKIAIFAFTVSKLIQIILARLFT